MRQRLYTDVLKLCFAYSGYDAALYSAATNYYQQQQKTVNNVAMTVTPGFKKDGIAVAAFANKPGGMRGSFMRAGRGRGGAGLGQQQTHYCEVCKISCAGPQVGFFF